MTLELATSIIALAGVITVGVLTRRSSKEHNATTAWASLSEAHQREISLLRDEINGVRERLGRVEEDLAKERIERQSLATVLRSAWSHIVRLGDQVRAMGGHPEPPPAELTAWMRQDGLIVDRVETTISRTTVTDTRNPDEPLEIDE